MAPLILKFSTWWDDQLCVPGDSHLVKELMPTRQKAWWASEPVCKVCRTEKYGHPMGWNRNFPFVQSTVWSFYWISYGLFQRVHLCCVNLISKATQLSIWMYRKKQARKASTSFRNQYNSALSGGAGTGVVMVLSHILNIHRRQWVHIQQNPKSPTSDLSFNVSKAFAVNLHTYRAI